MRETTGPYQKNNESLAANESAVIQSYRTATPQGVTGKIQEASDQI